MAMKIFLAITGICFGLLMAICPAGSFLMFLAALIVILIWRFSPLESRGFLMLLFAASLVLRIILVLLFTYVIIVQGSYFNYIGEEVAAIFGDSGYYTLRANWLAECAKNPNINEDIREMAFNPYGKNHYLYVMALFYYIFGFSPITVTFINCILGSLIGILFFYVVKYFFNARTARISACFINFFPSLVLWSITNLKDISFIVLTPFFLGALLKLVEQKKFIYLVLTGILIYIQGEIRRNFFGVLLLITTLFIFLSWRIKLSRKILYIVIIFAILFSGLAIIHKSPVKILNDALWNIYFTHVSWFDTPGTNYQLLPDRFYLHCSEGDTLTQRNARLFEVPEWYFPIAFIKSWFFYIFFPIPWIIKSKLQLAASGQMLIWYILIPFVIIGIMHGIRTKWLPSALLLSYIFVIASVLGMTGGNIGALLRHRDIVMPLLLIFASYGIDKLLSVRTVKEDYL